MKTQVTNNNNNRQEETVPKKSARMIARIKNLPTLPSVAGYLMRTAADPDSAVEDLIEVIRPDMALHLMILKIANSMTYGRMHQISSLPQAFEWVDHTELRRIVLSKIVFNSLKAADAGITFQMSRLWEHSFLCGLAARIMATDFSLDPEVMFSAGMAHDVGKLVIQAASPQAFRTILSASTDSLKTAAAEKQVIGVSHDQVGSHLLKRWLFPQEIVLAAGFHHNPEAVRHDGYVPAVIAIADQLAHSMQETDKPSKDRPLPVTGIKSTQTDARASLSLTYSRMTTYYNQLAAAIPEEKSRIQRFYK